MKKSARITAALLTVCMALLCAAFTFPDVRPGEWYTENIDAMSSSGLLNGYEDGTFRPDGTITYAEFISVAARCVGVTAAQSGSHWASGYMKRAYESGWYDYDEIYEADFDKPITRQMAVKIVDLAFDIPKNEQVNNAYYKYMMSIKDFNDIPGRYGYLVVRAYNNGILTGDENGNFNPLSNLTRAEACAMIMRARGKGSASVPQAAAPTNTEPPKAAAISGGVSQNGKLSVSGIDLVNQNGEPIVLRGMSSHGIQWYGNFASHNAIKNTAEYGANLFRVAMYTEENGYLSDPDSVKSAAYAAVDSAISNDMYVILDWHILSDGDPMAHVSEAAEFFAEASAKYAGVPNVIFEICNEPNGNISWSGNVKPYAETIIPIIRQSGDAVILVGSPTWSQDIDKAADDPLSFSNIMYACHFYAGTHGAWLRDRIDYARSKGAPIFISEWGTSAADGSGGVFLSESTEWLDFLAERNISWANWSLCDKVETSAALNSGTNPDGAWSDADLSESGKFVFSRFR